MVVYIYEYLLQSRKAMRFNSTFLRTFWSPLVCILNSILLINSLWFKQYLPIWLSLENKALASCTALLVSSSSLISVASKPLAMFAAETKRFIKQIWLALLENDTHWILLWNCLSINGFVKRLIQTFTYYKTLSFYFLMLWKVCAYSYVCLFMLEAALLYTFTIKQSSLLSYPYLQILSTCLLCWT